MKMVVMAGGQGTRFWPLSRKVMPKQFLKVLGEKSLFQLTVDRLGAIAGIDNIYVVCSGLYMDLVLSQAPELGKNQVIVEPVPRNTAPCIGLAAAYLDFRFPGEVMGVFPSDHLMIDEVEFSNAVKTAVSLAKAGNLVTFGIKPGFPATGYGYLERGAKVRTCDSGSAYHVARFTEKPDLDTANNFFASDRYFWNSGMFVWTTGTILQEINSYLPDLGRILGNLGDCSFGRDEDRKAFESAEPVSIDYGVMEKSGKVVMVPCDPGWNDVGDWKAVAEIQRDDESFQGSMDDVIQVNSSGCFVHSESGKQIALAGVEDLVVVETRDAILICSKKKSQDVGKIVRELKKRKPELT